ncbi:hypothetical protein ACJX0J_012410, partial [Zea mays]
PRSVCESVVYIEKLMFSFFRKTILNCLSPVFLYKGRYFIDLAAVVIFLMHYFQDTNKWDDDDDLQPYLFYASHSSGIFKNFYFFSIQWLIFVLAVITEATTSAWIA